MKVKFFFVGKKGASSEKLKMGRVIKEKKKKKQEGVDHVSPTTFFKFS